MKGFDLFVNKYPPGNDLRKPAAEMLEQFQGKLPTECRFVKHMLQ